MCGLQVGRHLDLVDRVAVDAVVVLADGLLVPATVCEPVYRPLVRRRDAVVQPFVPVFTPPSPTAFEECPADAVAALVGVDTDGQNGGVAQFLQFRQVEVDPSGHLVRVGAGDKHQP